MNKRTKLMMALLAITSIGVASLAYFTDRAESTFKGEAGTLCLTEIDTQHDLENMAPGDVRDIKFSYENTGSLSIDTRITYIMNYDLNEEFTGELDNIATLSDGDNVLTLKDQDSRMTVEGPTIKGTQSDEGIEVLDKTIQFKLLEEVSNAAQDMTFTIDVIIEGKQNKNGAEWDELNKKTIIIHDNEVTVVEESKCNAPDYTPYFKFNEIEGGYEIAGFVDNVEDIIEELGEVDPEFRYNPILPSEYNEKPVKRIWTLAFFRKSLESVYIPEGIEAVLHGAFRGNNLSGDLVIPDTVKRISSTAFAENNISSVNLNKGLELIEYGAFRDNNITSVVIPDTVHTIEHEAFSNNEITSIDIPSNVIKIEYGIVNNNRLPDDAALIYARNSDGTIDESKVVSYGGLDKNPIIPDNVTTIGHAAYRNNELISVIIPRTVKEIEWEAFKSNKIIQVEIPDTIEIISEEVFMDNELKEIVIPSSVKEIRLNAFAGNKPVERIVIPDSVKHIEYGAFDGIRQFTYNVIVYANELEGDLWPNLRGFEFSSMFTKFFLEPLENYQP